MCTTVWRRLVKAKEVTAGLAESNGSLLPSGWLIVTCELTACTPGSAPGPMLGNNYGKTLPFLLHSKECKILVLRMSMKFQDELVGWSNGKFLPTGWTDRDKRLV